MDAVLGIFAILLIIGTGFILGKRRVLNEAGSDLISKLTVNLALPCYMFANLVQLFDKKGLSEVLPLLAMPYLSMLICYGLGYGTARLFRVPRGRRGTFTAMFSLSNMIFIGLPVNTVFFGNAAIPYVLISYIANTTLFWTIGVGGIKHDGMLRAGLGDRAEPIQSDKAGDPSDGSGAVGDRAESSGTVSSVPRIAKPRFAPAVLTDALRRIFSPPLMGLIVAVVCIVFTIPVPKPVADAAGYLGAMTTPLSMLFIGYVLSSMRWKEMRFDVASIVLLAGRFVISPLVAFAMLRLADVSGFTAVPVLATLVLTLQSAMPAMTQTAIVARVYNADHGYAAVMTSLSTVVGIASLPLTLVVLRG